jgi:hypothetical protein
MVERAIWGIYRFAFFDHMRLWYMKNHISGEAASADNIITVNAVSN